MKKQQIWEKVAYPHIYMIENNINGKKYIGQHSGHNMHYIGSGTILKRALAKYGKENFSRIILEFWLTAPEDLDAIETNYIKLYDTLTPNGYNICPVGTGRLQHNNIPWNKGGGNYSDETREKMRRRKLGRKLNEATKQKMSQTSLGKPKSASHVMNMRLGKGKIVQQWDIEGNLITEYPATSFAAEAMGCTRESIRDACRGRIKLCKGYKWSFKTT